jgi:AcrR family transcriptional regulator
MTDHADETTRARLLDAAEKVFSEYGFEGASVRMINAAAQVDSGAIHYHFGSKADLFRAVIKRRGEILSDDRLARLARCTEAGRGTARLVEQIVAAYILPYANPALGSPDARLRFARLRARLMAEQTDNDPSPLGDEHKQTGQKFIEALSSALPHRSPHDVRMRYLIMWSALNTLSAGLGHAALEAKPSANALLEFEREVPELITLFASMFLDPASRAASSAHKASVEAGAGRDRRPGQGRRKR